MIMNVIKVLNCCRLQWIGRRALNFPKDTKKSDEPITQEMLDTLEKFKGIMITKRYIQKFQPLNRLFTKILYFAAESAYKCGVQIAFTVFLTIIALPKK